MTFEEMQLLMQQLFAAQRELQARQEATQAREEAMQTRQDTLQAIVESNSRAIQAMLDQAAEDRLNREEERLAQEQRTREHEERMVNIEGLSQRLVQVQEGMANLLISLDEDRATICRAELVEYARQAALDVRSGKLKPQSVAEIMGQLDEPMDE